MHECPECNQTCDCDGEDTWNDFDSSDVENCVHECEDMDEDEFENDDMDTDVSCSICYQLFGHAPGCPHGAEEEADQ